MLAEVEGGGDPSGRRHATRQAQTVAELCEQYLEAARAGLVTVRGGPKRPGTIRADEGRIRHHIVPLIGHHHAADLDRVIVQRMVDSVASGKTAATIKKTKPHGHAIISGGGGAAARAAELLGGVWSWAERRGYVEGVNPVHRIEKTRRTPKDRILNPEELTRLGAILRDQAATHPAATNVTRLLALTGLRYGEAAGLRWAEIDQVAGVLRLEESKTGRSIRPIGKPVWRLLESLPRGASEWVFQGAGTNAAYLRTQVAALFDGAGIHDARSHDLRRTYASVAADVGFSDGTIGDLLGHARHGVTARHYIRRADPVLLARSR